MKLTYKAPNQRDNKYYEKLLKKKDPFVYQLWIDGDFPKLRQALIAAKIKREVTGRDLLTRGWKKATDREKRHFLGAIAAEIRQKGFLKRE
jgi:hypothetical protein